jgi:hypothetical protein
MKIAAVVIDKWKLPIFKQHLDSAGYIYTEHPGLTQETLTLRVEYEWVGALSPIIEAAYEECKMNDEPKTCLTDGSAPNLGYTEIKENGQQLDYLVLCPEERAKGFVRPVRRSYKHTKCGMVTRMGQSIAETYARDPKFYGSTFCVGCGIHFPVSEFTWEADGSAVGS